jgi:hypothetical protein
LGFPEKERITRESIAAATHCALSYPRESILTSNDGLIVEKFLPPMSQLLYSPSTKE